MFVFHQALCVLPNNVYENKKAFRPGCTVTFMYTESRVHTMIEEYITLVYHDQMHANII